MLRGPNLSLRQRNGFQRASRVQDAASCPFFQVPLRVTVCLCALHLPLQGSLVNFSVWLSGQNQGAFHPWQSLRKENMVLGLTA